VRGVIVGYEGLARFDLVGGADVEELFARARTGLRAAEIEAVCLRVVLAERATLPTNCFLTVNVSPAVLSDDRIRAVWAENPDLRGVIVELTEQTAIDSYARIEPDLRTIRATGALLAVDDVGSGYAGLTRLLALRPALIKLDRELVRGIDTDEAKRALVEMIGTFSGRIDSWLLAEGIETAAEYDTVAALGVPLVQGYHVGRPGPAWPVLATPLAPARASRAVTTVRDLCDAVPAVHTTADAARILADHSEVRTVVLLDHDDRPVSVLDGLGAQLGMTTEALRINLDTPVRDALLRAITRDTTDRYDPLILTDNAGRYAGVVRMERLIVAATA
jgi:EAL domain-containing protein (putative c-di-GMP-specific phosphodiesterase class I)